MIDYDPHNWRTFFDIRGTMLQVISYRGGAIFVLATVVTVVHHFVFPLAINHDAHALIGPALSLLLVFRTNSSYDRFWEGRKIWGTLVNTSRNLSRLLSVHLHADPAVRTRLLNLVIAFVYSSMHELRGTRGIGPIADDMDPTDAGDIVRAVHPPTRVAYEISAAIQEAFKKGTLTDIQQRTIEEHCNTLVDSIGACERIHKTPLPFAYVMHLRRAIVLYCASLPFAMLGRFGWGTIAVSFLISMILFGIEEIGVEIEDPFGTDQNDLPLEQICQNIERNVRAFMEEMA